MKQWFKRAARWLSRLIVLPLVALYWLFARVGQRDTAFAAISQLMSLWPGITGSYLRIAFYRSAMAECSPDAFIGFGSIFSQQDTTIHDGVYIGPQCNIGRCEIGRNSLLGSGVHILSGKNQHRFDNQHIPIKDQGGVFTKVCIGADCWIGNGAIILADLGDQCIVGAGAVVINDVPPGVIVAGNPAKIIKSRFDSTE